MTNLEELTALEHRLRKQLHVTRPRRKRKGGDEWNYECPRCGKVKLDVNVHSGLYHCFVCGLSGRIAISKSHLQAENKKKDKRSPSHDDPPREFPKDLYRVLLERGIDPESTIARYNLCFDGSRICTPVGEGYWRRSIYKGVDPKVTVDLNAKGVLGSQLVHTRDWMVITEGDYKAFSIPLPFIGTAIGGVGITNFQVDIVRSCRPAWVFVMLDGGMEREAKRIVAKLGRRLVSASVVPGLPNGLGPDDVPIHERIRLLLEADRKDRR